MTGRSDSCWTPGISGNLCRRKTEERAENNIVSVDSTAYENPGENHLRMCLFPSVAAAATGLCSCRAARLRAGRRAGGRGGASPNQQQYKSPSFHCSLKSNEFNAHSQISPFSTQALNGSWDEAQIWCIRTQRRGIGKRFSPPRTTNPTTNRFQRYGRVMKCLDAPWRDKITEGLQKEEGGGGL